MKKMGRTHAPFYRICAVDARRPRDGRVLEELGYYDPMVPETDARAILKGDRVNYWVGVGAQPSDKVAVLIKKYGAEGTHLEAQKAALERLGRRKQYVASAVAPKPVAPAQETASAEAAPEEAAPEEAAAGETPASSEAAGQAPPAEAPTGQEQPTPDSQ